MNLIHLHIIKEAKNGSEKHRCRLMELYDPMLRRVGGYYLSSSYCKHADLEDALQETWIKVYKYFDMLADVSKFPGWISKIMKYQCINMQKKNTEFIKKNVLVDLENRHDLVDKIENDEIDELDHNQRRAMMSVMNELPEVYSDTLKMFYFSNMRIREIASASDISESLVKWRLVRAREMLKIKTKKKINEQRR